jgi:hypothetical protein
VLGRRFSDPTLTWTVAFSALAGPFNGQPWHAQRRAGLPTLTTLKRRDEIARKTQEIFPPIVFL